MKNRKNKNKIYLYLLVILGITIGFALLSTTLKIPTNQQITFVYSSFYYKEENVQVVETFVQEELQFETLSLDDFLN